jgi:UPF0755 protein
MSKGKKIGIAVLLVFVVGIVLSWGKISVFLDGRTGTINKEKQRFVLDTELTIEEIGIKLRDAKVIDDLGAFLNVAEYKELTSEKLGAGMYEIEPGTSYRTLLNGFTKGASGQGNMEVEVLVTFNNCATVYDLAGKVSKCIGADSASIVNTILDGNTLSKYDFTVETIPALFLPNSYKMWYDTNADQFIARMAEEFKKFWTAERLAKLKKVGLSSPSQAVTLASVVYGEQAKNPSEWPIIARLYLNRVNTGMRLQSDPTFKFCWGDQLKGVQRLTYEHRNKDCPYNTYLHNGLPPGPISIPPTEVVDAVLNPDDNDYIYMCAQPNYDGLHNFAVDYATHERYATEFQQWLSKQ